jgi:predicted ArsR family transcriptional regulator
MNQDHLDTQLSGIAALGEPVRRALYRYVIAQDAPVGRDKAATGVGVPRHTAKFHLDKLVEDGLLDVEFRRPPGRSGPGAGRPAKLYKRSARELSVSLPERRYDIAGEIMARAIDNAERDKIPVADALRDASMELGRVLGQNALADSREPIDDETRLDLARGVLVKYGYEPRNGEACVTLANCPFHALAQRYTALVCGMNLDLLRGILEGLQATHLEARLDPATNRCCVTLCEG